MLTCLTTPWGAWAARDLCRRRHFLAVPHAQGARTMAAPMLALAPRPVYVVLAEDPPADAPAGVPADAARAAPADPYGALYGQVVTSVTSGAVAFRERRVVLVFRSGTATLATLRRRGRCSLNLLGASQAALVPLFAGRSAAGGPAAAAAKRRALRDAGVPLARSARGTPVLALGAAAAAWADCDVEGAWELGDRVVVAVLVAACAVAPAAGGAAPRPLFEADALAQLPPAVRAALDAAYHADVAHDEAIFPHPPM